MTKKGTIKWYDPTKGYGFIIPEDSDAGDIFFHRSDITTEHPVIEEGKAVEYVEGQGKKGLEAKEIKIGD